MPVYVYRYTTGSRQGKSFELQQSIVDDALTEHEGTTVERVMQPFAGNSTPLAFAREQKRRAAEGHGRS